MGLLKEKMLPNPRHHRVHYDRQKRFSKPVHEDTYIKSAHLTISQQKKRHGLCYFDIEYGITKRETCLRKTPSMNPQWQATTLQPSSVKGNAYQIRTLHQFSAKEKSRSVIFNSGYGFVKKRKCFWINVVTGSTMADKDVFRKPAHMETHQIRTSHNFKQHRHNGRCHFYSGYGFAKENASESASP